MIDAGWLNVGSLLLGLVAWILPFISLTKNKKQANQNWVTLSFVSFTACAISLCFQIFYTYHLVMVEDWSALMDTMYAVAFASAVLLIVTIVLNTIILNVYCSKKSRL
ncbi:hypothetical protein N0O92_11395 [Alkalihalobacillus sp. MEB130]|uniref:hypothetical protein n=1 Tax=Alkalihalobacillus sp. MEB130 TaxID=2976704 RepID=UPI0028DD6932|nr:hypothetical protein [Alkalihalobacillus sp. MEB130]MDT8860835.1 hypothetical protein [Alkalihalobacillus sp. MEB130]